MSRRRVVSGSVGAGECDAFGAADDEVGSGSGELVVLVPADLHVLAVEEGASGGDVRVGRVQGDALFVAQGTACLVQPGFGFADAGGVRVTRPACGFLGLALHGSGEDACQAGVLEVAGGVARTPFRALAGLLHPPLLPFQFLLGVADVLLGVLLLGAHGLLVVGEVASVETHVTAIELGDVVHPVEESPVVADQQQTSPPLLQHCVEPVPRVQVEVVGGFVEQQYVGAFEELGCQAE